MDVADHTQIYLYAFKCSTKKLSLKHHTEKNLTKALYKCCLYVIYHFIFDKKAMNFMWLDAMAAVLIILMFKNHKVNATGFEPTTT